MTFESTLKSHLKTQLEDNRPEAHGLIVEVFFGCLSESWSDVSWIEFGNVACAVSIEAALETKKIIEDNAIEGELIDLAEKKVVSFMTMRSIVLSSTNWEYRNGLYYSHTFGYRSVEFAYKQLTENS